MLKKKSSDEPDIFLEGGKTASPAFSCAKYRVTVGKDLKINGGVGSEMELTPQFEAKCITRRFILRDLVRTRLSDTHREQ